MKMSYFILPAIILFTLTTWSCKQQASQQFSSNTEWFAFHPKNDSAKSLIDMSSWLDAPAGKHGFVQVKGKDLVCEDGTPIKFWGVNICSQRPYSDNKTIDKWVNYLAKYGINGIRFHKFTYHGMPENVSTQIDSSKFHQFDYFQSKLREKGLYYGWSPIYGHKPRPGDAKKLLAYDEIAAAEMNSHLSFSTIGLVNFAEDLQDLHIELIVNMLNHVNPYTGKRYADDPALSFIEFQNEDNIFFATNDRMLELCPTYKKLLTEKFTQWLREKYKNQEGLLDAWGKEAIEWGKEVRKTTWNLDEGNITPVASHGIYDYEYQKALENNETMPRFLLDMARFLYEQQLKFYRKFEKAIRETGYKGALIGSCWQAGSGISHFYNLHTDYKMGIIDRHNYFGGGTGHRLVPGEFKNKAMVSKPGSGLLSTGLQMVSDRPFALSEWMSLPPNEWIAEGPVLIATYGLGLQGWDASYAFASDFPEFTNTIHTPGVYNVNSPTQIALYPALVSTIYNADIKEGKVVSERNVHIPSLKKGKLGFNDAQEQNWDQKIFGGVPQEALAAGRVVVNFTDEFVPTTEPDLSAYVDTSNKVVKSSSNQLRWDYSGEGFVTINTPSLQGFVGFSQQQKHKLNDITLSVQNSFAVVLVSSLEKGKNISEANHLLVTTMARAKNTGMKFNEDTTKIVEVGEEPIMLEPVQAILEFNDIEPKKIHILDHVGQRTGKTIEPKDEIYIDGAKYKTLYYEIVR